MSRTTPQLIADVMPELKDSTHTLILVEHSDGTVSWHGTTDSLNRKLGLLRYVTLMVEEAVQRQLDIPIEPTKDVLN